MMMYFHIADWMVPNCPVACEDAGKIDGLPIDPNDDNYERNTNDKIADQGCYHIHTHGQASRCCTVDVCLHQSVNQLYNNKERAILI